jgi:hypothetical protein
MVLDLTYIFVAALLHSVLENWFDRIVFRGVMPVMHGAKKPLRIFAAAGYLTFFAKQYVETPILLLTHSLFYIGIFWFFFDSIGSVWNWGGKWYEVDDTFDDYPAITDRLTHENHLELKALLIIVGALGTYFIEML